MNTLCNMREILVNDLSTFVCKCRRKKNLIWQILRKLSHASSPCFKVLRFRVVLSCPLVPEMRYEGLY